MNHWHMQTEHFSWCDYSQGHNLVMLTLHKARRQGPETGIKTTFKLLLTVSSGPVCHSFVLDLELDL